MLFGNLFASSIIYLSHNSKEIGFSNLTKEQQNALNNIKANFSDSIENRIGTLYDKIKFLSDQNVNGSDTVLINNTIHESEIYFQKVFKEMGYPQNTLFSLKSAPMSHSGWLNLLKNVINKTQIGLSFKEYCNGIKTGLAYSSIEFNNGKLWSVYINSYSSPYVKVTSIKPKLSVNQAIQSFRNNKHISDTIPITPFSYRHNKVVLGCINNIPFDSLPIQDLIYLPDKTDSILTLYWKIWIANYENIKNYSTGSDIIRAFIDATTGDILYEGFGGCFNDD